MYNNSEQAKIASLIISIIILIIIIVLIVVVCCNWNTLNANANAKNPQALVAAAAMYNKNQGMNVNMAANAVRNNPQKAALGAYAYNKNNFDAKQRIVNIANAIQYPGGGGSDWANFIKGGTAKTAAQSLLNNNFNKTYKNCYSIGTGQVVCTTYIETPKKKIMGYNHPRLANIKNAKQYPGSGSDWANWIQGGQARGIAQNKVHNIQNHNNGYRLSNIQNAKNGGSGSDWAMFIKNGQARGIAQKNLQMYQNSGCPTKSHITQMVIPGVCGITGVTASGNITTHCSGTQVYGECVPNNNASHTANGCLSGSHMTQMQIPGVCGITGVNASGNITTHCSGTQTFPLCVPNIV